MAALEVLGPLATPFFLPALVLDLARYRVPEPATLEATATAVDFRKATTGL